MPSINFDKTKSQRDSNNQWCICSTNLYYQNFKEQIITISILMFYTKERERTLPNSSLRWQLPSYPNHTKVQHKEYMPNAGMLDHNFYAGHLFLACWGASTLIATVVIQVCTLTNIVNVSLSLHVWHHLLTFFFNHRCSEWGNMIS